MKILFIAPPFAGHINCLLPLAGAAREAGHNCGFFTGEAKAAALRARGYRVLVPRSIPADAMEGIANWHRQTSASPLQVIAQLRANLAILTPLSAELGEVLGAERPDVAVVDFCAAIAGRWCDELRIPWITTIATPFAIEVRRGVPSYLGGWSPMRGPIGAARDAAGRLAIRTFKRLVYAALASRLRPLIPRLYREDGTEAIYSPGSILGFGIEELELERDWPASFEMIGPVPGEPESAPPLDLPAGRTCVLASFGTHLLWAKDRLVGDMTRIARALPDWHFVVSLGRSAEAATPPREALPNLRLHSFIPYQRDLGRFDVVIHHGGSGVTNACIAAGRPSLVVPHDYDQFDYAARIAVHGLGLRLRSLADPAAVPALRRLARHGDWPALARFQTAAAGYRPLERFLAALDRVRAEAEGEAGRARPSADR